MFEQQKIKDVERRAAAWEKKLALLPERQKGFITASSVPMEVVYTPAHIANLDYLEELGFPGEYPFTRGVHPTGYRGRLWTMRMFSGYGTAEESNARFKYLLEHGETGLSIAFD